MIDVTLITPSVTSARAELQALAEAEKRPFTVAGAGSGAAGEGRGNLVTPLSPSLSTYSSTNSAAYENARRDAHIRDDMVLPRIDNVLNRLVRTSDCHVGCHRTTFPRRRGRIDEPSQTNKDFIESMNRQRPSHARMIFSSCAQTRAPHRGVIASRAQTTPPVAWTAPLRGGPLSGAPSLYKSMCADVNRLGITLYRLCIDLYRDGAPERGLPLSGAVHELCVFLEC